MINAHVDKFSCARWCGSCQKITAQACLAPIVLQLEGAVLKADSPVACYFLCLYYFNYLSAQQDRHNRDCNINKLLHKRKPCHWPLFCYVSQSDCVFLGCLGTLLCLSTMVLSFLSLFYSDKYWYLCNGILHCILLGNCSSCCVYLYKTTS